MDTTKAIWQDGDVCIGLLSAVSLLSDMDVCSVTALCAGMRMPVRGAASGQACYNRGRQVGHMRRCYLVVVSVQALGLDRT